MNLEKLTEEVTQIETVAAGVEKVVRDIAAEVRSLRSEAGGALQTQLDALANRLDAVSGALGLAVQDGTAADETKPPKTSEEVIKEQTGGAAQAAADHLDEQAANAP